MRAFQVGRAYASRYRVHLAVLSQAGGPQPGDLPPAWCESCEALPTQLDTHFHFIQRMGNERDRLRALTAYPRPVDSHLVSTDATARLGKLSFDFDVVHVMRLYLAPLIEPILQRSLRPLLTLDCDDDDAAYHRSWASIIDPRLAPELHLFELAEAAKYEAMQEKWLPLFDRVLVASPADVGQISQTDNVSCLPNVVEISTASHPSGSDQDTLRVLFVGNLEYPPNADALAWISRELAPRLVANWPGRTIIDVAGRGIEKSSSLHPCMNLHGFVADLAPLYDQSDLAIAPLRFGSGTPIKVIEALVAGVPVVATSFVAGRLRQIDGPNFFVADKAEIFAQACIKSKYTRWMNSAEIMIRQEIAKSNYSNHAMEKILFETF